MEFKDCPHCKKDNRLTAKFCVACGKLLNQVKDRDTKPLLTTKTLNKWNDMISLFVSPIQLFIAILALVVAVVTLIITFSD